MAGKIKRTTEDFINESISVHGNLYDYSLSEYTGVKNLIKIICPIHGLFEQSAGAHLHGSGCQRCGAKKASAASASTVAMSRESFVNKAVAIHGNKYNYDKFEYVNTKVHGLISCNSCYHEWLVRPDSHLHMKSGCPVCNKNKTIYTEAYYKAKGIENHPCKIYLTEIEFNGERFLKLGLTKDGVRHRFRGLLKKMKINEVMIATGDFFSLYRIEQELIVKYSDKRFIPVETFKGHTECFDVSVLNDIKSSLAEMLVVKSS